MLFTQMLGKTGKRLLSVACIVLITVGCVFLVQRKLVLSPITAHQGDGTFQDISRYAGPFPLRGYSISMPEFDMGHLVQLEYHISRLPRIGEKCGVFLAIREDNTGNARNPEGMLELELLDSHGRRIAAADGTLTEFTWTDFKWSGVKSIDALYQEGKSFFDPDPNETYRLRVTFKPQTELAHRKAFVYLRCGGSM